MIPYAFASLVLILSTLSYCMYYEICHYRSRKIEFIESCKINDVISHILPKDGGESDQVIRIKQMWKDYQYIEQTSDIDWSLYFYCLTVLITLGNIVFYTIKEYSYSEKGIWDIIVIVLSIMIPVVICVVIWIVFLHFTKDYKTATFQSVKDLKYTCDDEYHQYNGAEGNVRTIIKEELEMKSKRCVRSTAVMIFFLMALLTLATSFFSKTEYEIEEEQSRIEESYQSGYNDGYLDGYSDGAN